MPSLRLTASRKVADVHLAVEPGAAPDSRRPQRPPVSRPTAKSAEAGPTPTSDATTSPKSDRNVRISKSVPAPARCERRQSKVDCSSGRGPAAIADPTPDRPPTPRNMVIRRSLPTRSHTRGPVIASSLREDVDFRADRVELVEERRELKRHSDAAVARGKWWDGRKSVQRPSAGVVAGVWEPFLIRVRPGFH